MDDSWRNDCLNGRMDGWMIVGDDWMDDGWVCGYDDKGMRVWMDGYMDAWMEGCMDVNGLRGWWS